MNLGYFDDEEEASRAYFEAASKAGRKGPVKKQGRSKGDKTAGGVKQPRKEGGCDKQTSLYKGVGWIARAQRWSAYIFANGKKKYLGYFSEQEEAARKYDEAAAPLGRAVNFPTEGQARAMKGCKEGGTR